MRSIPNEPARCHAPAELLVLPGQALLGLGQTGIWRLTAGCVVLFEESRDLSLAPKPLYLARAGDLIGVESLTGDAAPASAQALASSRLVALTAPEADAGSAILIECLQQARRQARDMLQLRTGMLRGRVEWLLALIGFAQGRPEGFALPPLRQLGLLLDASPEAICRALSSMRPNRPSQAPRSRGSAARAADIHSARPGAPLHGLHTEPQAWCSSLAA
jgi:hypothetical protein